MLAPYSFSHSLQDFIDICHTLFGQLFSRQISDDAPGTVAIQRASDSQNQAAMGEVQHGNTAQITWQYSPRSTRSTSVHVALYLSEMAITGVPLNSKRLGSLGSSFYFLAKLFPIDIIMLNLSITGLRDNNKCRTRARVL